ncbi:hypothetical protein JHW43_007873 [Diplocarpon mali]|nr:hypothetical protein JHW43_007873 [Diplocarpon mali]
MATKTNRKATAWKEDIQIMTIMFLVLKSSRQILEHQSSQKTMLIRLKCLLRLRCQPAVPYHMIAALLLETQPSVVEDFAPEEASLENSRREWLEKYLEEIYDGSEKWESEAWKSARSCDETVVRDVLKVTGLDVQESEFAVMEEDELLLQIKWRKEGDLKHRRLLVDSNAMLEDTRLKISVDTDLLSPQLTHDTMFTKAHLEDERWTGIGNGGTLTAAYATISEKNKELQLTIRQVLVLEAPCDKMIARSTLMMKRVMRPQGTHACVSKVTLIV